MTDCATLRRAGSHPVQPAGAECDVSSRAAGAGSTDLSRRAAAALTGGLMLGLLMSALDTMIMATAMRSIADQLQGLTLQAWVTTAYLITTTISTPLYGKLSDLYGRKPLYAVAIGLFIAGSVLCGFAQSMQELAAFRALQGLGGGGLITLSFTIVADVMAPEQRARHQAYLGSVFAISTVLGPLAGGFFAGLDTLAGIDGWRWAMLINVPIGVVALILVSTLLKTTIVPRQHRLDVGGAAALIIGLVPLLVVIEQGATWGWGSTAALGCFVCGLLGLGAFALIERAMGDDALLPMQLFRHRVLAALNVFCAIIGMTIFAGLALLPLYLQLVKGLPPMVGGMMLIPQAIASFVTGRACSAYVVRSGSVFPLLTIGTAAMTVSALAFAGLGVDTPLWQVGCIVAVLGAGLGLSHQVMLQAVPGNVPHADLGAAMSGQLFFQRIGGAIGTAIFLALLFHLADGRIAAAFRAAASTPSVQQALADPAVALAPANLVVVDGLRAGAVHLDLNDSSFLASVDPRLARPILEGLASSIRTVYLTLGCVLICSFLLALWIHSARSRSPRS